MNRRRIIILSGLCLIFGLLAWLFYGPKTAQIDSYAKCAEAGYPVMESEPPVCRAHGHNFIGPRASSTPTPDNLATQSFELLVEGDSAGGYPQRQEVIHTQADWQRYWREVHAGLPSQPPLIPVDFTRNDVVALSEGRQPTSGYNLKITSILTGASGTTINATESIPTVTCIVAQHVTNRYYIARTAKLPEPVKFQITHDKHRCS